MGEIKNGLVVSGFFLALGLVIGFATAWAMREPVPVDPVEIEGAVYEEIMAGRADRVVADYLGSTFAERLHADDGTIAGQITVQILDLIVRELERGNSGDHSQGDQGR